MHHPYWGEIADNADGIPQSGKRFLIPGFGDDPAGQLMHVLLDRPTNDAALPPELLEEYAETFQQLLQHLPALLPDIKARAFAFYQRCYADVLEDSSKSGEPPLGLTDAERHFNAMRTLEEITVRTGQAVTLQFDYVVDTEHDLEILFVQNAFHDIGSALTTYVHS